MNRIKAIKTFFEADGGRKLDMNELKALSKDDRIALGNMAAQQLGVEIIEEAQ